MERDRYDLLDMCIATIKLKYNACISPEQLQDVLNKEFPRMMFSIDEIVEFHMLAIEIEDNQLILKNTGNG